MTETGIEQSYELCYDDFMALRDDQIYHNTIPVEYATAEARELALAAETDRADLMSHGLAPEMIDSLRDRANAYTWAVSKFNTSMEGDPVAVAAWKEAYPEGYELKKYLMRYMTFAYRDDKRLSAAMEHIRKGKGHRDMIQDLLDLYNLGTANPELLKTLPAFDFDKLAEARAMSITLGDLFSKASLDPKMAKATKEIMNRAWTWYKMAADRVKETGQFVFEGTDRYDNYVSEYRQKAAKKSGISYAEDSFADESDTEAEAI